MFTEQTPREQERTDALRRYGIVDSDPEPLYDDIAMIAARICDAPYAAVTFVDDVRCWFKAGWDMPIASAQRHEWFCSDVVERSDDVTVIADTCQSERHSSFPTVASEPYFRFYAGAPIVTADGFVLGAVCVLDSRPREICREQVLALQVLSRQVMSLLELRRSMALLELASIKMQMLADRDGATGLPSERMFRTQLRTEFQYARRHNQLLSLVLLDVDDFSRVSEMYGAERGDEILKRIARIVGRDTRDYDLVARSGRDEFAVVMRNSGSATAIAVAQRIKSRIASAEWTREPIEVSIGVSTIQPEMIGSREMIDRARAAIFEQRKHRQPAPA